MAAYYVRITGNDSNAGTSAGAAWRTIGKALGASGASSGDTVYIGPGVYAEAVTVNAAAAGVTVSGDPLGQQTGDRPGEVLWLPTSRWQAQSGTPLSLNGVDTLTFTDMHLYTGTGINIAATSADSNDITLSRMVFTNMGTNHCLTITSAAGVASNWTVQDCVFNNRAGRGLSISLNRHTADYDSNIQVKRCLSIGEFVFVASTGAGAGFGGGVDVDACTGVTTLLRTLDANLSTSIPCTITDSLSIGTSAVIIASSSGQITSNGGNITGASGTTNVTAHVTDRIGASSYFAYPVSLGHEYLWGLPARQFGSIYPGFAMTGRQGSQTTDIANTQSVSDGTSVFGASGTATSATTSTISDSGAAWGVDQWKGWLVVITGGTGSGQVKRISSNTATALTISGAAPAGGLWATTPSTDSTYIIYQGPPVETGKATAGAATSLTDSGANWISSQWVGYTLEITGGTGNGQTAAISANTSTALTVPTWGTNPDNTSTYSIYRTGLGSVKSAPGGLAAHNTAKTQTTVLNGGSTGYVLDGYASQDFLVPVSAGTTTITVPIRYDSNHGATNKPQVSLIADAPLGISATTSTMTAGVDTWESVAVSCTATAAGFARVRVQARSGTPYGRTYIDGGAWRFGRAYGQIARQFQLRPVV